VDLHRRARIGHPELERGDQIQEPKLCHQEGLTAMLVLSRKKNESIVINNDITVTVVEIRGDKVRLGIVAPKEVPVHRQEVYEAIHGKPADTEAAPSSPVAKPD
jgi:carbon storage regulator